MARSIFYYTDSRAFGGAEQALLTLIGALDRDAWEPTLLLDDVPESEPLAERTLQMGVPIRRVAPMPLGLVGARRVPRRIHALRAEHPDVFHAHLSWPLAAKYQLLSAVAARVPAVVATVQLVPPFPLGRLSLLQLRAISAGVGRYIAVSRAIETELRERFRWPASKLVVIHNAVDVQRLEPARSADLRDRLQGGQPWPLVLTCARLHPQKGHSVLLEAAARVPAAIFALAGDGPERAALEQRASQLGVADRVRFLGQREDVPELLAACDVFVLPSLYEGCPLSLLEAMGAGRPVIGTAIPGTDELITDGQNGLLVAPGDAVALAGALRRVLAEAGLRRDLAERARERVERGFTAEVMAAKVTRLYEQLLGAPAGLTETERNDLLRRVDWRFLLRESDRPAALNLARGRTARAIPLIADAAAEGDADLVVLSRPRAADLGRAHAALRPGGELYCEWRLPAPGRGWRVRRSLAKAGFVEVRPLWPGPRPWSAAPQFWLPLDSAEAVAYLLAKRSARNRRDQAIRVVWRVAARAGSLSPLGVIARRAGEVDEPRRSWLLLSGGKRSINKVIGLAFDEGQDGPVEVLKFARVPESEQALAHEADVLRRLADTHTGLRGIPTVLSVGQRSGRLSVAETAVPGEPLLPELKPENFPRLARELTDWLLQLAGASDPVARAEWWDRLVQQPLERFEQQFGSVVEPEVVDAAHSELEHLGPLPIVFEHRDCAPWNIVLSAAGNLALLDWESAEPQGLPLLDLVYFLANATFILEGALDSGRTRESYRRMLDPSTAPGAVAAQSLERYCHALGLDPLGVRPLRLLTWIVHARSDYSHSTLESPRPPAQETLAASTFLGLVREELACPAG